MRFVKSLGVFLAVAAGIQPVLAADGYTILEAIKQAVATNPGVGEAAANRRATESELRQQQGTLLPQVRLEARTGKTRYDFKDAIVPPQGNDRTLSARESSIVVRQILFDGFTSINEIWRQSARVDAAASRVRERSELIALDAAEAYVDVLRYMRLVAMANENVAAHRSLLSNVQARFRGGRAGEGDLQQVQERVEAATAVQAQFRQQLDEARGTFRKVVGIEPHNLRAPGRLHGLPASKDEALAVTLRSNPTIQAAQADRDAAKFGFDATAGAFVPSVAFEGRALWGHNTGTTFGDRTDMSAMVVASWDIFRGGQDSWRRVEMSERYQEQSMRHARLQRGAYESIDKAWAARTITADRIAALSKQIEADRKVISAYQKEYELGQRSLIDLLNAQNQLFNAGVSLESARSVAVFADYQLLAAMGHLLDYLKTPHPVDSAALEPRPLGLFPTKFAPILLKPEGSGSQPLNIGKRSDGAGSGGKVTAQKVGSIDDRWPAAEKTTAEQWLGLGDIAGAMSSANQPAMAFAPTAKPVR